jgi:hypothetical protein
MQGTRHADGEATDGEATDGKATDGKATDRGDRAAGRAHGPPSLPLLLPFGEQEDVATVRGLLRYLSPTNTNTPPPMAGRVKMNNSPLPTAL